jgi:aspartate racemase
MFGSRLAHRNIRLVLPTQQEQDDIQRIYFDELVIGRVRSPSRQRLLEIAQRMRAEQLIDGVLLAGTELPLLLREERYDGLRFIDTSRAHVEAAVAAMLPD